MRVILLIAIALASHGTGQRIHTVELGNSRYFVSNASPYSPQLNWFLAYQYCRTIGMELLSLERQEEVNAMQDFLGENSYGRSEYWTSGNQLGSSMWIWMSTGQPFNSTFHYWPPPGPPLTKSQQSCMTTQDQVWQTQNCMDAKPFICEQTRCFYFNYVTSNRPQQQQQQQGNTTIMPGVTRVSDNLPSSPLTRPLRRKTLTTRPQPQRDTSQVQENPEQLKIMPTTRFTPKVMPITGPPKIMPTSRFTPKIMPTTSPAPKFMPTRIVTPKIMPTTNEQPFKIMPTAQTLKSMPTTSLPLKTMPTESTPLKTTPQNRPPLKVMPITPKSMTSTSKSMLSTTPTPDDLNNEIFPINPLLLLQPPQNEFTAPSPTPQPQVATTTTTLTGLLSRKETFSWALLDGDYEQ